VTKTFVSVTMSVDGYLAPPGRMEDLQGPAFDAWTARWGKLQDYVFHQEFFRRNLRIPGEGEKGPDNDWLRGVFERTGVTILGKRMFDGGEKFWPEEAPFHTPVFVVTHQKREPWVRPGGTTFHFVNDGIHSAHRQALAVAGGRDVRIGGGGETIAQFLRAGLVDELHVAVSPVMLGGGVRMFDGVDFGRLALTPLPAPASPRVTHLRYAIGKQA
jgi:dihydrofolate reductase